ncbi:histidine phosphatase family protein [Microbacterium sp. P01]|uniref:histidine phosphatase family protein n=1 Tax=Microbacterium sp. P01 TaxID=3366261 RepID=UPI00367193F7
MGSILLVRHGEASGDDSADPGLSSTGRLQALALAGRLADQEIGAVWHGPKRRAQETAGLLASHLRIDTWSTDLLDDRTPVPSARFRNEYTRRRLDWFDAVPEDERDEDGLALAAAWSQLRSRDRPRRVVMVTHSFVISQFVALAVEARPSSWLRLTVSNAGLTILHEDAAGDLMLRLFNDTTHIPLPSHGQVG